ncbi:molybdopterin-dependent oxidoreductase [bacterium]|nr:molybdopterin-dependent oxidoreductase [bacterium]
MKAQTDIGDVEKLKKQPTICTFCGCGCAFYLFPEGFLVPAQNHPVSRGKLCLRGWSYADLLFTPNRLKTPLVRRNDKLEATSWDEALQIASEKLKAIKDKYGGDAIGVLGSARASVEDNFTLYQFASKVLGTKNIDSFYRLGFLRSENFSFPDLEKADQIILLSCDIAERHPQAASFVIGALSQGAFLYVIDSRLPQMGRLASIHIQPSPMELLKEAENFIDNLEVKGNAYLLYSSEITLYGWAYEVQNVLNKAAAKGIKPIFLCDYANQRGMIEAGIHPQGGLSFYEMLEEAKKGNLKALVIMADNPSARFPQLFREAREKLDFLLVIDPLRTDAVEMADVAFPGTFFFEKEGTTVNAEGRRQALHPTVPPAWEQTEIDILLILSEKLGSRLPFPSAELIEMEKKEWQPEFKAISPNPTNPDYPFTLLLDPSYIWSGTAMANATFIFKRESSIVLSDFPNGFLNMNSEDAKEMRIRDRMIVNVETPKGSISLPVLTSLRAGRGILLFPLYLWEKVARELGGVELDEALGMPIFKPLPARIAKEE